LVVPLKAKGIINGIIILGEQIESETFSPYEREYILTSPSWRPSPSTTPSSSRWTTTDMMTKLKMKHYFYTILMERMDRLEFGQPPLRGDDGHRPLQEIQRHLRPFLRGRRLKQVAKIVRTSIRGNDLAARYGARNSSPPALPTPSTSEALVIAERITRLGWKIPPWTTRAWSLRDQFQGHRPLRSRKGHFRQTLIDRADKALYESKGREGNKTTISR
jgi:GGDEF domain-containing protein